MSGFTRIYDPILALPPVHPLVLDAPAVTLAQQLQNAQQAVTAAETAYGVDSPQYRQAALWVRALTRLRERLATAETAQAGDGAS